MDDQGKWRKDLAGNIKGRIGEAIVEQLFKRSGMNLYHFGIEWRQLRNQSNENVTMHAKGQELCFGKEEWNKPPDFLLFNGSIVEFIEVKYRKDGEPYTVYFGSEEDDWDYFRDLWRQDKKNLKVIWLSQSEIRVIAYPFMIDGGLNFQTIENQLGWKIKPEVLSECISYLALYSFFNEVEKVNK